MGGDRFDREASRKSTSSTATSSSSSSTSTSSSSSSSSSSSLSIASPKSHSPDPEKLATTDHTFDSSASPTSFGRGKSRATTDFGESLVFQEADDDDDEDEGEDDDAATDGSPLGPPPSAPAPAAVPSSPHRRFHSRTNASLPAGRSMGAGMKSTATMGESLVFEEVSSPTADGDGGDSVSRSHSRSQPSTAHLKKDSGFSYTHNESLMFEEVPGEDDGEDDDDGGGGGGRRREEEEEDDDEARIRRSPHPEEDADEGAPHAKHTSPSPEKHARYMPPAVAADTPATQPQQDEDDAERDEEAALPPAAADVAANAADGSNSNHHTGAAKAGATDSSNNTNNNTNSNNNDDDDEERRRRRQRRQQQQPEGLAPPPSDHARSSTGTHRTDGTGRRSTAVRGGGGSAASEAESGRAEAPAGSAWPNNLRHEAGPARTERHKRKEGGWAMVNQPGLEKEGRKHRDAGYVGTVFGAPPSPVAVAPPTHGNRERGAFRQLRDIDKDRSEVICGKCKTKGHPTKNCPLVGRERFFDATGGVEHRRNIQGTFKDQQYTARMQARIQRSRPDLSGVRSKFRDWKQPAPRSGTLPPHSEAGASGRASARAQHHHHHNHPQPQPRARAGSRTSSPSHPAGGSTSSRGPSPVDTARSRGRTASVSPADRARKEFVIHKLHEENRMLQEAIENMRYKMHAGGAGGRQGDPSPEATVPMAGGLPPTHRAGTRSGGSTGGGGGILRSASGSSGYAPRDTVPPEPQPHPSTASHQQYKQQQQQMMLEQQHQREQQQQYNAGPSPRGGGRSVSQPRSSLPPQSGWVDMPMQKKAPTRVRTAAPSFVDWQVASNRGRRASPSASPERAGSSSGLQPRWRSPSPAQLEREGGRSSSRGRPSYRADSASRKRDVSEPMSTVDIIEAATAPTLEARIQTLEAIQRDVRAALGDRRERDRDAGVQLGQQGIPGIPMNVHDLRAGVATGPSTYANTEEVYEAARRVRSESPHNRHADPRRNTNRGRERSAMHQVMPPRWM